MSRLAPSGASRSAAPGRGRALRHHLAASEAGHDPLRSGPRCVIQTAASGECPTGLARSRAARRARGVDLSRLPGAPGRGGDRASSADAARRLARRAHFPFSRRSTTSISPISRRSVSPARAPRSRRTSSPKADADSGRQTGPWQNAPCRSRLRIAPSRTASMPFFRRPPN